MQKQTSFAARGVTSATKLGRIPGQAAMNGRCTPKLATSASRYPSCGARFGVQRPFIAACPGILPSLVALVTPRAAKLVCFCIQHGVQRLLDRPADHLTKMIPDPGLINLDNLAHRLNTALVTHPIAPSSF